MDDHPSKKPLRVYSKLLDTLEKNGFKHFEDNFDLYTLDKLNELDYVSYVIKESLRIDPPAIQSLIYSALEDITICGVKIPKGQEMQFEIIRVHHNEREYSKPREYIPERFDPDSKYYSKPDGTSRSATSWTPFSIGPRLCTGMPFALLELKVALVYMMTHLEFSVDEKMLKRDDVGFAATSHLKLYFRVDKIKK
jgi:cytochrome P450